MQRGLRTCQLGTSRSPPHELHSLTRESGILPRCRHRHAAHGSRALCSHARGSGCAGHRGRVLRPAAVCTLPCGLASAYRTLARACTPLCPWMRPPLPPLPCALQPPTARQRAHANGEVFVERRKLDACSPCLHQVLGLRLEHVTADWPLQLLCLSGVAVVFCCTPFKKALQAP
jgi:hypothetical protein